MSCMTPVKLQHVLEGVLIDNVIIILVPGRNSLSRCNGQTTGLDNGTPQSPQRALPVPSGSYSYGDFKLKRNHNNVH